MRFSTTFTSAACGAALALLLSACSGQEEVVRVSERRVAAMDAPTAGDADLSTPERMGFRPVQPSAGELPPGHPPLEGVEPLDRVTPAPPATLQWQTPEGWALAPPRPMREATFLLAGEREAECYVTILTAAGGGVGPNVNRWRAQMGLPPLTDEEIAGLPAIAVFGQDAPLVEIRGDYTGIGGETRPGYLLYGVVAALPERSVFVKMTGPADIIERERDAFIAFCRSLELGHVHEAAGEAACCPHH